MPAETENHGDGKKALNRFGTDEDSLLSPKVVLLSFIGRNKICFYRGRVIMRNWSIGSSANCPVHHLLKSIRPRPESISWRPLFVLHLPVDGNYYYIYRCSMSFSPWPNMPGHRDDRPTHVHPAIEVAPIRLVMGLIEWTLTTLGFREDVNESRREASTLFWRLLLLNQGDQGNQELLVGLEGPT